MSSTKSTAPEIKVEDPGKREDGTFESSKDQTKLYYFRYLPSTSQTKPPLAQIIFTHGYAEHSGRYFNLFPLFAQANISITGYDLRGYGLSWTKHQNPKKAHGDTSWKQQFEDLEDLIRLERERLDKQYGKDKVPIYLMGHSMGGGITFGFLTRPNGVPGPSEEMKKSISGVILSAPWFKLTHPPPGILFWLAPKLLSLSRNFPWTAGVAVKELSNDPQVQKWTEQDPLVDGHVYLRTIIDPLFGGVKLADEEYKNYPSTLPLLICHGGKDPVTSFKASKEVVEKAQVNDKEHKEFPGCLHEVWHEKGDVKIEYIQYMIE